MKGLRTILPFRRNDQQKPKNLSANELGTTFFMANVFTYVRVRRRFLESSLLPPLLNGVAICLSGLFEAVPVGPTLFFTFVRVYTSTYPRFIVRIYFFSMRSWWLLGKKDNQAQRRKNPFNAHKPKKVATRAAVARGVLDLVRLVFWAS